MTLEKQTLIDKIMKEYNYLGDPAYSNIVRVLLEKHIPQEDTYQKTTVPNVLLYETGYKQGREDMKKEIIEKQNKDWDTYNEWTCVEAYDYEFDESLLSPTDTK